MSESTKTALITGGSKGIGFGIAQVLIREGIRVAITSRSKENAEKAAAELNQISEGFAIGIESDVRSYESQQQAVQTVLDKWGQLDYFIANAGVGHFAPIEDLTPDQWKETIDINLTGVFFSAKASLSALKNTPVISVSINPGATALERIFREPSSSAIDLVKPIIPALEAA